VWNANSAPADDEARVRTRKRAYLYEDEEKAVSERQSRKTTRPK